MNRENIKTDKRHRFRLELADKIDLRDPNKNTGLANLSINYTWNNIKSIYNNDEFKISAPTWKHEFQLPNGLYSTSNIQDYLGYLIKKNMKL